jgi:hypothetical protein
MHIQLETVTKQQETTIEGHRLHVTDNSLQRRCYLTIRKLRL